MQLCRFEVKASSVCVKAFMCVYIHLCMRMCAFVYVCSVYMLMRERVFMCVCVLQVAHAT